MVNRSREAYYRRLAYRLGVKLQKASTKSNHTENRSGYRLVGLENNYLLAGEKFDLSLEDVAEILSLREKDFIESGPGSYSYP